MSQRVPAARQVFINCPYDAEYLPILHAILFCVHDCGFSPQFAVNEIDGQIRLQKIVDMMRASHLSIHDISRLPTKAGELPRFNMPFECGVFVGLKYATPTNNTRRQFLLLDAIPYRAQQTMSDVAGLDPKVHHNNPAEAIECVRHFLASELRKLTANAETAPGGVAILQRYQRFQSGLPAAARSRKLRVAELRSFAYLADMTRLMASWIDVNRN